MPRISRAVVPGFPYHVAQRGNYQECVSEDKDGFIGRIEELLARQGRALARGWLRSK